MTRTYRRVLGGAAIDDIISYGNDPGRGPWPRRLLIGTIIAVVLAALIVEHLPGGAGQRPARHARHPRATAVEIRPARPDGIPGPTSPWAAGLRLLTGGSRPAWLYPATGLMRRIGGLPAAGSGYVFTRVGGGWALQPGARGGPWCARCSARPLPVYFLGDRASSARMVGLANQVAPAAEPGAVWLTSYPPGSHGTAGVTGFAQEFSAAGRPLGPRLRLPAGYVIDAATRRGLLLTRALGGAPAHELWNPSRRRVTRTFRAVIAASADKIAWTPRCVARCLVRVLDLSTGRTARIALLGGSAARGAFSQDGRLLAIAVSIGNGGDSGATAIQLQVASLPGGRLTAVPGTWASSDALSGFGWPADDDSLVAELSFMTKVQVASWRPGSSRLAVAVLTPREKPNDLVVG